MRSMIHWFTRAKRKMMHRLTGKPEHMFGSLTIESHRQARIIGEGLLSALRNHTDEPYVMTDVLSTQTECHDVPEKCLWKGEVSAKLYIVGCYQVRVAVRCYEYGYQYGHPNELKPISLETYEMNKNDLTEQSVGFSISRMIGRLVLVRTDISARHMVRKGKFNHIYGIPAGDWHIQVPGLMTAKRSKEAPDDEAVLCLRENYSNSSISASSCYICQPNGKVSHYSIYHSYSDGKATEKWQL